VASGSLVIAEAFRKAFEGHPELRVEVEEDLCGNGVGITGCHGFCAAGPLVKVPRAGVMYCRVSPEDVPVIIETTLRRGEPVERLLYKDPRNGEACRNEQDIPFFQKQMRVALRHCGEIDPEDIDDYLGHEGYEALRKALDTVPADVIDEVNRAGLQGRGGAGFPTGFKWKIVADAPGSEKYIVCNGDEGDPGAFMDRSLMEGDPHAVLEGMTIAARAVGAQRGFIYVRAEYPLAVARVKIAVKQARERGYLGSRIFGREFSFDVSVVEGAGAFVCGEETALLQSIQGLRGMPRPRPPYPAREGLWGRPTLIDNVETFANVAVIVSGGAEKFSRIGTNLSKGTKTFALTGHVNNIGLVEVPMGITLREIVFDIGGGIPGGRRFKAAQTGGPSGGCIPAAHLDTPIDYESLQELGSMMGSGGLVVMDETTCMVELARFFLDFMVDESCGKCPPCRIGTRVLLNVLERITAGKGRIEDIEILESLGAHVQQSSLCGLGQTAPNAALSTLRHFRQEYEAHIKYKKCEAAVCRQIVSSPCKHSCPIDQDAACYIGLIALGKFDEALRIVRKDNPLPGICGRVCDAPCELKCRAGAGDGEPISIRSLKRFLSDYERANGLDVIPTPKEKRGERVAIVGSGPAGLTCGYYLALAGYPVTIFESLPVAGGMLAVGIPGCRLPKDVLAHDIRMIKKTGVEIKTNVTVGKDVAFADLQRDYQAIFIATGAHKGLKLGIEGDDDPHIFDAVDFLRDVNLGRELAIGPRVAVIGGGNSAVDAARAALRLAPQVKQVKMLYRRTKEEMPALPEEIVDLDEEDVDVEFLVSPVRILRDNGTLTGLELTRMKLGAFDGSGRRSPVPIEGSEFTVDVDTVIAAPGQEPELGPLEDVGLKRAKRKTLVVDPETLQTNLGGVFAGGDVVTGPLAVTPAMGQGKVAARMIMNHIEGRPVERHYEVTRPAIDVDRVELSDEETGTLVRPEMPTLPVPERAGNFREVALGLTTEMAVAEAKRCLRCDKEVAGVDRGESHEAEVGPSRGR
jgi:NADH-quinone oxidoreductase subunit F